MGSAPTPEREFVWGAGRARVRFSMGATGFLVRCDTPPFHQWLAPCGSVRATFHRLPGGYRVRFPDDAEFEISRDGARVCAQGPLPLNSHELLHLFWNHVFPLAASIQGLPVLHAGAVEIEGCAVAFLGASGFGKSTLTAALASAGFPFLTDDALALVLTEDEVPLALPGHTSIRLWPDSADQLARGEPKMASVSFTEKIRVAAGARFPHCDDERAFACIYLLGEGTAGDPDIQAVAPAHAVFELAKSSFLIDPGDPTLLANQFAVLSRIAARVPVFRFDYPRSFDALRGACDALARHASQLAVPP